MTQRQNPVEYLAGLLEEKERLQILLNPADGNYAMDLVDIEIARVRKQAYDGTFNSGTMALPIPRGPEAIIQQEVALPGMTNVPFSVVHTVIEAIENIISKVAQYTGCTIKLIELGCGPSRKPEFVIKIRCLDAASRARVRLDIATEYVEAYLACLGIL